MGSGHKYKKKNTQKKIRLSQCMIVKNEERNIRNALSWGSKIVYEQIVVDTGSTDNTIQIAREMGATVLSFPWTNDFSAAKNFALEHAKGNWIAFLDADEALPEKDVKELMHVLKTIDSNRQIDVVRTRIINLGDQQEVLGISSQDRIFRNDPNLRYRYRIHEELYHQTKKALGCQDEQDRIAILHTGYGKENRRGTEKGERNVRLLQRDLAEEPDNLMRIMYLGDALALAEKESDAMDCYRKVLQLYTQKKNKECNEGNRVALLRSGLQLMTLLSKEPVEHMQEESFQIAQQLRESGWGFHPDIDFFIAVCYLKSGDIELAADYFEKALKKMDQYKGIDEVRMTSRLRVVTVTISLVAEQKGDLQKAVRFAVMALRVDKYAPDALLILLRSFLTEYRNGNLTPYWNMLTQIYDPENLKDMLFLHKIAGECDFFDLQEKVLQQLPEEARIQLFDLEGKQAQEDETPKIRDQ